MQKIDFINNSTPALNATNLNKLQQNIADSVEKFENSAPLYNVDANDFTESGFYYLGTGCQNVPKNWIKLIVNGGSDRSQIAINVNSSDPSIYFRTYDGYSWSEWKLINSVYEAGSNSNGNYRKYADGTLICYGSKTINASFSQLSSLYRATLTNPFTFPSSFINNPVVYVQTQDENDYIFTITYGIRRNTTGITQIDLLRIQETTGTISLPVSYFAIGRWKWL